MLFEDDAPNEQPPIPTDLDDLGHKPDDDRLAIKLASLMNGNFAFFHSAWREYERGCWRKRDVSDIRRRVRTQLRKWREKGVKVNQSRINSLTAMLEDDLSIPDTTLMEKQVNQARYVNMKNGLFNFDTMQLEAHDPSLYFTTQLDFDYDADAYSPTLHKYLNSSLVFPDGKTDFTLKTLALEALAYCLTARTDMKASFWLVGAKDSGKSTFVTLIKSLMGDLHGTIDLTQLGTNRFLLSGIVGKRVITFTEASSNTVLPDALYKALVGGTDEIYADVKNRDGITFRPECKVVWSMNDGQLPRISDRSGATTRRIHMLPFKRTIPESERVGNLEQLLSYERPGIFNALIDHLKRLQANGEFTECKQSQEMLAEYALENDTEATFVEECCEKDKSYITQAGEFHQHYKGWCETNGFHAKSSNQVAREWRRLGFEQHNSGGRWWKGVRLKNFTRQI